jgi:hypothetical protein
MSNVKAQISWFDKLTMGTLSLSKDGIWILTFELRSKKWSLSLNVLNA